MNDISHLQHMSIEAIEENNVQTEIRKCNDISSLQNMSTEKIEENIEIKVQNDATTYNNFFMNLKTDSSSIYKEIVNSNWWNDIEKENRQCDVLFKENEKYSCDIMYADGEIKYTRKQIEIAEEHSNEIETLIKETVVKLKELEHEKNVAHDKVRDKHNAFKRATKYYKTLLDLYIQVEKEEDVFNVRICYFTQKFDDTYSLLMSKKDNEDKWTLISVKPQLEDIQFAALQKIFNNTNNMSGLLCTVRKVLVLYKNSRK